MQHVHDEKQVSLKISVGSMALFLLSIASFIVILWVLTAIVRTLASIGAS